MGKTRYLFKKIEIPREHFMKNGHNKGQKWYKPNRLYYEEVARIYKRTIQKDLQIITKV